jgi:hypothetical protein
LTRAPQLRIFSSVAILLSIVQAIPLGADASANLASASTAARAVIGRRTALDLSASVLQFHVTDAGQFAEASVTFAAAARTTTNGEVVLVVRVPSEVPPTALTVVGGTEGVVPGMVASGDATVVARWVGGGRRTGQLQFRLRATPGVHAIPVSFQLEAP